MRKAQPEAFGRGCSRYPQERAGPTQVEMPEAAEKRISIERMALDELPAGPSKIGPYCAHACLLGGLAWSASFLRTSVSPDEGFGKGLALQ